MNSTLKQKEGRQRPEAINKTTAVIFGTSGLGNFFVALDDETKYGIVKECFYLSGGPVVFDSAGKAAAGLGWKCWANAWIN